MKYPGAKRIGQFAAALLILLDLFCPAFAVEPDESGGIGGTGITGIGVIQRFGSIFVNGREYFLTNRTRININGNALRESDLHLGDVVLVKGRTDSGSGRRVAVQIRVQQALQGLVENVDVKASTLTVLGQTVHVMPNTYGDAQDNKAFSLAQVHVNDSVAISGLMRGDGSWTATRVSRPTLSAGAPVPFVLRGILSRADRAGGTMIIGAYTLTIAPSQLQTDLPIGRSVLVVGHYRGRMPLGEAVRLERHEMGPRGTYVELSGYIQSSRTAGEAVCNGIVLHYNKDTQFVAGMATNVVPGVPVMVQGVARADGSIAAERIVFRADLLRAELPPPLIRPHENAPRPSIQEQSPSRPMTERPWIGRPERP